MPSDCPLCGGPWILGYGVQCSGVPSKSAPGTTHLWDLEVRITLSDTRREMMARHKISEDYPIASTASMQVT
jgi:hypothetical protein